MLLEQETLLKFNYQPSQLSNGSRKKVVVQCDYCNLIYDKQYKERVNANKDLDKDACKKCRFKKREDKCLLLHGVKNSAQRSDVKLTDIDWDGFKDEISELYTSGHSILSIAEKLNIPKTSLGRKIEEWQLTNDSSFQERRSKTMVERYGEDYKEKQGEKLRSVSQEKYGVDNPFQAEEVKAQARQTSLEKYGVDHHFKNKEIMDKARDKTYQTKLDRGLITLYNGQTIPELAEEAGFSRSHFNTLVNKYGFEEAMSMEPRQSSLEKKLSIWLSSVDIDFETQFYLEGKYADFKIGDLIIELDGLYWHSEKITTDNNYHKNKRDLYIQHGYKPLFFREDEVNNKFPIVQSIILHHLNKSSRIFARKTQAKPISKEVAKQFMLDNHLMGKGAGQSYGLYHEEDLVMVMQIKRVKGNHWEVSRLSSKLNTSVIGGFSKLLKHIERNVDMESLKTFVDLRYGTGSYLDQYGFDEKDSYLSFKWTNGEETFGRMKFPGVTGYLQGLVRIYDCGQKKFMKQYSGV